MRIIANFSKGEPLRFISHLDVMRLLQRAMRRAGLPLAYSQGFNPHPVMAFASALAVGYTSDGEWVDVMLEGEISPEALAEQLNRELPEGISVRRALAVEEKLPTLTALLERAQYEATLLFWEPVEETRLTEEIQGLLNNPIVVTKRTKSGMKQVDIRPQLVRLSVMKTLPAAEGGLRGAVLDVEGILNADGGLQMELLLKALLRACGVQGGSRVHRKAVHFKQIEV